MPKGPRGEKRPADLIGCAVNVARIATGEAEDDRYSAPGRKRSGQAGASARAAAMPPDQRVEIARNAARARWSEGEVTVTNQSDVPLVSLLFGGADKLVNVKCFTGDGQFTEEEVCQELKLAIEQRRNGIAVVSNSFNDDAPKVDVRALVASLQP